MENFSTPMMQQYMQIKSKYQDCLLFFRMGDFYELFMEDARIGAQILNITLTSKAGGKDGRIPMAGIPYHAVDTYLTKLIQAGYKVAICEQLSPPSKKGLVKRDVVRIVTPGTILNENSLEKKANNYLINITIQDDYFAIAVCDVSTGYLSTTQHEVTNLDQQIKDLLARFNPSECILPQNLYEDPQILKILKTQKNLNIYCFQNWSNYSEQAANVLKKHFNVKTLAAFNIEDKQYCLQSCAVLLGYLQETQKSNISHIRKISLLYDNNFVLLDRSTMINLELFSTIREHDTRGSLLSILDQTVTAMGGRLLKQIIIQPLIYKEEINNRLDAVEVFTNNLDLHQKLREKLSQVSDIERLLSRLCVGLGNARDLVNLQASLQTIIDIKQFLQKVKTPLVQNIYQRIDPNVNAVIKIIQTNIVMEPPISTKDGGMIQDGVHEELDKLRTKVKTNQNWILELEKKERARTGISSLKVKFNQVFGFYIDITKANMHLVPDDYIRKQTLVSSERFMTPELKEHEEIILMAEEKINQLEFEIFNQTVSQISQYTLSIQGTSQSIAILDCLTNFAFIAQKNKYTKPKIKDHGKIKIKGGRHPVVEKLLDNFEFVPNDLILNQTQSMLLITGPNMAGKSVFIRQAALIVLMAQIGCFVPAQKASITPVDKIFVRSGASDIITSGLSTFMVEMVETAFILHHATPKSLVIMDEIGRGTSTYDGISIAWAVAEYLVANQENSPKILFATHYHELQDLEQSFPQKIKNYHLAVENNNNEPIFLYTLLPGGAPASFGIAVAKLAGIPHPVIEKALGILEDLESKRYNVDSDSKPSDSLISNIEPVNILETLITKELEQIDIYQMTPLEALNKLADLKEKIRFFQRSSKKYLDAD